MRKTKAPRMAFVRLVLAFFILALTAQASVPAAGSSAGDKKAPPYPEGTISLEGVVIRVTSAKELALWVKGRVYPFSLYGISFPKADSPGGWRAKKRVSDMAFNKLLKVYLIPDEKNPPPGIVIIRGRCLNEDLVRAGMARVDGSCRIPDLCQDWKAVEAEKEKDKNRISGN